MKTYKGTDNDMCCRGFQYEIGKTYKHNGAIKLCESGFHGCVNPLDVITFCGIDGVRFFEVEQSGQIIKGNNKIVSYEITFMRELTLAELIKIATVTDSNDAHAVATGFYAHAASTNDYAHAVTTGSYAHAASTNDYANAITDGDYANAVAAGDSVCDVTSGRYSHAVSPGDESYIRTTGRGAHAISAGDDACALTCGQESISCAIGIRSRAKINDETNIMVLIDWRIYDGRWYIYAGHCFRFGDVFDGVQIELDTWYWFENGKICYEK